MISSRIELPAPPPPPMGVACAAAGARTAEAATEATTEARSCDGAANSRRAVGGGVEWSRVGVDFDACGTSMANERCGVDIAVVVAVETAGASQHDRSVGVTLSGEALSPNDEAESG